ncbi:hypothetical protein [Janthinobacterium fluminis]|uniref:Uncharacterized protein n=1 Tax=Janthinobacterium fluminis TaxID=2987524 RepID=A0ABT5JVS6_9BURK|nr:hypothetical protein [Janthinobacterium fluminis]MDC8756739.1 hypothetical protein [Janthinobacterium fluminis]
MAIDAAVRLVFIGVALALSSLAQAAGKPETWDGRPKPLKGDYQVFGGTLSEAVPPTKKDRKVAFMFTGPLGKDLFEQIGPDLKEACGAGPDHRTRRRGDLSCVWAKDDGYACYFGLDVPTGKSTNGSIC